MKKKLSNISEDERNEFRQAMEQIVNHYPVYATSTEEEEEDDGPQPYYSTPNEIPNDIDADAIMHFQRGGLQYRLLQKYKRGKIPTQASLDLHRLTVNEAETATNNFFMRAKAKQWRCVHIIHGKGLKTKDGQAKLKNWLNRWLSLQHAVLAFHSAKPCDGGTGAVYVLLKKER